jgi:hypothetical protein
LFFQTRVKRRMKTVRRRVKKETVRRMKIDNLSDTETSDA